MGEFTEALRHQKALTKRMDFSCRQLKSVRDAVAVQPTCSRSELCIYAAGSLGRLETGQISDLDIFLFADRKGRAAGDRSLSRLEEIMALSELIQVNKKLDLPPFSGDGQYFKIHEVSDLLTGTGTSTDDSENLFTTRLLLLLESKCVVNDTLYQDATKKIVQMYFRDGDGRQGYRPLFLLNDILRYWRTVCLNYERTRADPRKPWWKKNLNLKFSRKLTVFSSVLAILVDHIDSYDAYATVSSLTPLERLAYALDNMADSTLFAGFQSFLNDYEEFLAAKSHSELEDLEQERAKHFRTTADRFDQFLHSAFGSSKLDRDLVKYLLI